MEVTLGRIVDSFEPMTDKSCVQAEPPKSLEEEYMVSSVDQLERDGVKMLEIPAGDYVPSQRAPQAPIITSITVGKNGIKSKVEISNEPIVIDDAESGGLVDAFITSETKDILPQARSILGYRPIRRSDFDERFVLPGDEEKRGSEENFVVAEGESQPDSDSRFVLPDEESGRGSSDRFVVSDEAAKVDIDGRFLLPEDAAVKPSLDERFALPENGAAKVNADERFVVADAGWSHNVNERFTDAGDGGFFDPSERELSPAVIEGDMVLDSDNGVGAPIESFAPPAEESFAPESEANHVDESPNSDNGGDTMMVSSISMLNPNESLLTEFPSLTELESLASELMNLSMVDDTVKVAAKPTTAQQGEESHNQGNFSMDGEQ
jgi:hypothetical protein